MAEEIIQKDSASIYYEMGLEELIKVLNRMHNDLENMELKWTRKSGFETCILNFSYSK
jgi:hypothetical protein